LLWTCLPWCVMIKRCGLACVGKQGRGGEGMGSSGPGKGLVCVVPLVGGQWAARSSAENRNYLKHYDTEIPIRYRYTGIPPGKRYRKSYRSVNDNLTQRPRNAQQRASLRQCHHCVSALFRRLAISPSRPSVGPFTPPLHRRHRIAMLSLRRARRVRSFFGPALRIRPFFCPLPPPFFAPARRICHFLCPPPSAHPHAMQVALYSRSLFSSMRSTSFPVPPPGPCRSVHSSIVHFLRHLPASAVDLPLRVAARRVLRLFALLTIALY